jgi:hypothetical protein
VPKFCRHGTLAERCPICHANVEAATRAPAPGPRLSAQRTRSRSQPAARGGLTVRREARADDDGYRTPLAPGLRSSNDARRLAEEIAFATARLDALATDPPGLYAEVAAQPDIEEASWLALLIAYLGPLEDDDPFAAIAAVRVPWGELPDLAGAAVGPRGAHDGRRGDETLVAYARLIARAGSQELAFTADRSWPAEQRFARLYERLALPGLHHRARYDLLVTLGRLGRYGLAAPGPLLTEDDAVMLAAKRIFAIGDRLTLERRARELATAAGVPIEALDLALENWAATTRVTQGFHGERAGGERFEAARESALADALAALSC